MMGIQDLHLSRPSTNTSSSSSLSCSSALHPLSISTGKWQVGEETTKQVLSVIQPTASSEKRRREIVKYLQTLLEDSFGIKVFPFGSAPLKTYLPHGDIDLTAVSHYDTSLDLPVAIHKLLQSEMTNNSQIQVRDVLYGPAQGKVVKCTVSHVAVDISFNQTAGLSALWFLEQVDQLIGNDHLFKRSVILIKAWCYYESRLLGGYHGLISTYALETLVLHVINHFHRSLHCPLAVLYKFLDYYSTFDWVTYCVAVNGLVSISSLPEIAVQLPNESDELLLTDGFLRNFREKFLSSTGALGIQRPTFPVKFFNILDPLRDDNNLGRSVSKGNFYRIRSALSYGTEKLYEVLMLPPEKITDGLEKFFVNTLDRNGKGRRADVVVSVPEYSREGSEISYADEESNDLLGGIEYDMWFLDYGIVSPGQLDTSATQLWGNEWMEIDRNMQFDHNMYYEVRGSPLSSVDSLISFQLTNATPPEGKGKCRGTGLYFPQLEYLNRSKKNLEGGGKEEEEAKEEGVEETKSVDSQNSTLKEQFSGGVGGGNGNVVNYSLEEFPLLPRSKPLLIKVSESESPVYTKVDHTLELESFKCLSPKSVTLSEPGKQSDSDVSTVLEGIDDLALAAMENQESSKSKEKPMVLKQPLLLKDENEFPPLSSVRHEQPAIKFSKKEFPLLGAVLKPQKRGKREKNVDRFSSK